MIYLKRFMWFMVASLLIFGFVIGVTILAGFVANQSLWAQVGLVALVLTLFAVIDVKIDQARERKRKELEAHFEGEMKRWLKGE